jgi:hypothetical protein
MVSYHVGCGVQATDNDHFKLAELRLERNWVPSFLTGLRALRGGHIEILYLDDNNSGSKLGIASTLDSFGERRYRLLFSGRSSFVLEEKQLDCIEHFVLKQVFDQQEKKKQTSLSFQLEGVDGIMQLSVGLWVLPKR